jgi:hypothetical protein
MGLLTGLLTLPLAPVRGVARVADQVARQAERELYGDESSLRRELAELQRDRAFRKVDEQEFAQREELLLAQLEGLRVRRRFSDEPHSAGREGGLR